VIKLRGGCSPRPKPNQVILSLAFAVKFRAIARSLNIADDLKLYCARHTFGTVATEEPKDPSLVRDTTGHEDLKTTMEYMHPDVGHIKAILDRRNEQKF